MRKLYFKNLLAALLLLCGTVVDAQTTQTSDFIVGDFVFNGSLATAEDITSYTTSNGLPGTLQGSNYIWYSPLLSGATTGIRITVFATNGDSQGDGLYEGYPMVALGELEFYDSNDNKIIYTAANVTTNSLEMSEGSLAGLCDGDYSTFYHSMWKSGTFTEGYVYVDVQFPQVADGVKIKMVGRITKMLVPTEIEVAREIPEVQGDYKLIEYTGNDSTITLPATFNGENYKIGNLAFFNNTTITSVTIPEEVTSIAPSAFGGCTSLSKIIVKSDNKTYDSRYNCDAVIETVANRLVVGCKETVIPASVTTIGDYAFYNCIGLAGIKIPVGVTEIENSAFEGCIGLENLVIPEGVAIVGTSAFSGCENLVKLIILEGVETIGDAAFDGCSGLAEIYATAKTPATIAAGTFTDHSATLYVPAGAKTAYEAAEGWANFTNIVEMDASIVGDVNSDGSVDVADVTTIVAMILNNNLNDLSGDVNGDGTVDVADITNVVSVILGTSEGGGNSIVEAIFVALDKSLLVLSVGEEYELTVEFTPKNITDTSVTWLSSDTAVATVVDGKVTAVAAGKATVTVQTTNGLSATCDITVVEKPVPGGSEGTEEIEW